MTAIFGIDYGGASTGIVHQDRLVLAGGGGVPDVVAASKTGDWTDFDDGGADAAPDDGFWFQQVSARGNRFHAMLQQQGLLIFGDVGESAVPPGPFTAASVEVRENSWVGSDTGRTPIIAGNLVVFLQRGGEDCRGILWNEQQLKYLAISLLQLSGNVFAKARDMTYQPSAGRRGDTVYVVDESGELAVLLLRVGEETPAWSQWQTHGRVVGATAPLGRAIFLVERGGQIALETLAPAGSDMLDAQVSLTAAGAAPAWMRVLTGGPPPEPKEGEDPIPQGPLRLRWVDGANAVHEWPGYFRMDSEGRPLSKSTPDADDEDVWALLQEQHRLAVEALPPEAQDPPEPVEMQIGLRYERVLETVQFVRRSQSGSSARIRPMRVLECVVDYVLPRAARGDRTAANTYVRQCDVAVIPVSKQRARRRPVRPRPVRGANGDIVSVLYPARAGWRDRIAVELSAEDHVEIAGVAYKASA